VNPIEAFAATAVLVVGDVMLDEYLWGEVDRISPEAPVPVVRLSRRTCAPGGAGNAAVGVAALGGRAVLGSVVGDDDSAARLRAELTAHGVHHDGVLTDPGRPTTVKSRLLAQGQHVVRMDAEVRTPVPAELAARLDAFATGQIATVDAVLVSDYGKGVVSEQLAQKIIGAAVRAGLPVVADPTATSYRKYRGATIVTPSVDELAAAGGRRLRTGEGLRAAVDTLAGEIPGTAILVTRGPDGMRLFRRGDDPVDIPTLARSVYDVTGAGDTVAATIAVALGAGYDTAAAVGVANVAAGLVVEKAATAHVTAAELAAAL
jgi:rfaE bifunctional protein kinase chain/domain